MMGKAYRIKRARDEQSRVPFEIPLEGDDVLSFVIPKLQYMSEAQARAMKEAVREIDTPVQQSDPFTGELYWEKVADDDGKITYRLDEDGEKVPLMGPPQRTLLERTRCIAMTMLGVVVEPEVFENLQQLTTGELDEILQHWTEESNAKIQKPGEAISPGESGASSTS